MIAASGCSFYGRGSGMSATESKDESLASVLERLDALERENESWRAETARLAHELSAVKAAAGPAKGGAGEDAGRLSDDGRNVSRRGALLLGVAAAAGAAAHGLVRAEPADANNGDALTLGSVTNSASAPTGLSVTGNAATYGIGVTDNGLGSYPATVPPAALLGHARNANFQSGVLGYSDTGMYGVVGSSDPIDSTGRPGVFGVGQPGVSGFGGGTSPGVVGTGNGTGVLGIGPPAVQGLADAYLDTGVQGTNRGTVLGAATFPAEGVGVLAECMDGGAGPPAPDSIALSARNDGSGTGVKATSDLGIPIWGQISNSANAQAAVYGTTNGKGVGGAGCAHRQIRQRSVRTGVQREERRAGGRRHRLLDRPRRAVRRWCCSAPIGPGRHAPDIGSNGRPLRRLTRASALLQGRRIDRDLGTARVSFVGLRPAVAEGDPGT